MPKTFVVGILRGILNNEPLHRIEPNKKLFDHGTLCKTLAIFLNCYTATFTTIVHQVLYIDIMLTTHNEGVSGGSGNRKTAQNVHKNR